MKDRLLTKTTAVLLAVAFTVTESLAAFSPQLPNPGNTGVSRQQQIQIGQKAMAEVYKQMPVLPESSPETQYVQQLGRKLVAQIPPQYSWPYQFHVVQQKEINAFALPGGPIFVNIGTITAADNEAELAGVISHEMSHVYMQHSVKQMRKNTGPSILAGVGQILGQMMGGIGGAVTAIGGQMIGGILSMRYSRADEAQADAVGAIIMYKAGYDPHYLARFFQKLEAEGSRQPQFLSDHPDPGNRYEAINKEVANWPAKSYTVNSQAFVEARQAAQGVRAYSAQQISDGAKSGEWARMNQESGSIPRNLPVSTSTGAPAGPGSISNVAYSKVQPSGNFVQTRTSLFTIARPDNWREYPDQQGNGLMIAPPAGVAEGAIAYGVIINGGDDPKARTLDEATQDLIRQLGQENTGLRAENTPRPLRVNGVEARSVDLTGASPITRNGRPEVEHDWLVALANPQGGLLYLVFVAPESQFEQLRPTYEQMLRSLHLE